MKKMILLRVRIKDEKPVDRKERKPVSGIMKPRKEVREMERMTVRQLAMVIQETERLYISPIDDISCEVEITNMLRAYTGIMNLEVITLTHHEEGYTATVDMPPAAIAALAEVR